MPTYYGRFRHVYGLDGDSENIQEDLVGFFDINNSRGHIKEQLAEQFENVFRGEYGRYGRSYVLIDFGKVVPGKGYLIREEVYLQGDLERLAEKAFE